MDPNNSQKHQHILERLQTLIHEADAVLSTHSPNPPNVIGFPTLNPGAFEKWRSGASALLYRVAGSDHPHLIAFGKRVKAGHRGQVEAGRGILESFLDDYNAGDFESNLPDDSDAISHVLRIAERFHGIARQLRSRYNGRPTLALDDEYDVQDLIHALLRMFFDDVRAEEWTPSYAGGSSRVDFLLKTEQVIIEIKRTRKSMRAKELGTQLIDDIARYRAHPDCQHLVCFVYDPEGMIPNPRGVENDLTDTTAVMPVTVLIRPE